MKVSSSSCGSKIIMRILLILFALASVVCSIKEAAANAFSLMMLDRMVERIVDEKVRPLFAEIDALEERVSVLVSQNEELAAAKTEYISQNIRTAKIDALEGRVTVLESRNEDFNATIIQLSAKTECISQDSTCKDMFLEGCDVDVLNGLGKTDSKNGKGNVIIGYNENVPHRYDIEPTDRNGSHYLVLGSSNSYTSWGGMVAGAHNRALGPYGTVTGGSRNNATGYFSSVSGGRWNVASTLR